MKAKVKRMWIKALRGGQFTQGRNQLRSGKEEEAKHCCLGVLCELAKRAKVIKSYTPTSGFPPRAVVEWAGLSASDPVIGRDWRKTASRLNDNGRSFEYIAKKIEKYL